MRRPRPELGNRATENKEKDTDLGMEVLADFYSNAVYLLLYSAIQAGYGRQNIRCCKYNCIK